VAISELSLNEDSPLLQNDHVDKLYVEYTFLGVPREETETPYSLPKPDGAKPISFNFTKGTPILCSEVLIIHRYRI